MTTMQIIDTSLISGASILITFFFTSFFRKSEAEVTSKKMIKEHEEMHHKKTVEDLIHEHQCSCGAPKDTVKITKALIYIVVKLGGDPNDLGLME